MDTFLLFCVVHLLLLQIVDLQELVDTNSYKGPFHIVSLVLMILLVISYLIYSLSKILLEVEDIPLFPDSSSLL